MRRVAGGAPSRRRLSPRPVSGRVLGMRLARLLGVLPLLAAALAGAPALAQRPPTLDDEAKEIAARLEADEPTERAYGAMAVLAIARREAGFKLLDRPALQP